MKKLTAEKCREMIHDMNVKRDFNGLSIREDRYLEAIEIALPVLEQQEKGDDVEDVFIVMRKPGCMPVIKRPVGEIEGYLTQLYSMNAGAVCDVVTYTYSGASGQWAQDGREILAMAEVVEQERERGEEA